jgi:hypothetical protein
LLSLFLHLLGQDGEPVQIRADLGGNRGDPFPVRFRHHLRRGSVFSQTETRISFRLFKNSLHCPDRLLV